MAHIGHWYSSYDTVCKIRGRYPESNHWAPAKISHEAGLASFANPIHQYAAHALKPRVTSRVEGADLRQSVRRYLRCEDVGRLDDAPRVYAIWSVGMSAVKIGHSGQFKARMREFRASSADLLLPLLAVPGDDIDEAAHHLRCHGSLSHSEWFHCVPDVTALVAKLGKQDGAILWRHIAKFSDRYREQAS